MTGVVEESPGPLEYEVGLYREGKKAGNRYGRKLSKGKSQISMVKRIVLVSKCISRLPAGIKLVIHIFEKVRIPVPG